MRWKPICADLPNDGLGAGTDLSAWLTCAGRTPRTICLNDPAKRRRGALRPSALGSSRRPAVPARRNLDRGRAGVQLCAQLEACRERGTAALCREDVVDPALVHAFDCLRNKSGRTNRICGRGPACAARARSPNSLDTPRGAFPQLRRSCWPLGARRRYAPSSSGQHRAGS